MHESRCGVCCNSCERKDKVGCRGCLNMEGPFWGGTCGVKSCCEKNKYDHCGVCPDFPCDMLSNMGKEEGFDPSVRLDKCREWRGQ